MSRLTPHAADRRNPTLTAHPAGPTPEAAYLRRWVAHQARLHGDLLATVARAPRAPRADRA